jgi:hypothetical protein
LCATTETVRDVSHKGIDEGVALPDHPREELTAPSQAARQQLTAGPPYQMSAVYVDDFLWPVSKADPINRHFFSSGVDVRGNLPQSLLSTVYNEVVMGIIIVHHHVPSGELLGLDGVEGPQGIKSPSGGGGGGGAMRSPSGGARRSPKVYQYVFPTIKSILAGASPSTRP